MTNIWLKIWSLFIALLLAGFVHYFFANDQGGISVLQLIVPVEVKNLPADKMILLPLNRQAEVTLRGSSLFLSRIASTPLIFRVSAPPGANAFVAPLKPEDLNLPPYVQVLGVRPTEIEFTLDNRVTKTVPVVVPRIGSISENFKLENIKIEPERIEVRGPETEIKHLMRLETHPLDLRDINESLKRELEVRLPGGLSESDVRRVSVTVEVSAVRAEERFENLPVEVRSTAADSFAIKPLRVNVRVSGAREQIRALKGDEIIPYVRVSKLPALGEALDVAVELPRGLSLSAVDPKKVVVVKPVKPGGQKGH